MIFYGYQHNGVRKGVPTVFIDEDDIQSSDVFELAERMTELVPNEDWTGVDLVIDDPELSVENQRAYINLLNILSREGLFYVIFETTGQTELQEEFDNYLQRFTGQLIFACKVTGQNAREEGHVDVLRQYSSVANSNLYLWITVDDGTTDEDLQDIISLYQSQGIDAPFYLSPAKKSEEGLAKRVHKFALTNKHRYSNDL